MNYDDPSFWIGTTSLVLQVVSMIPKRPEDQTEEDRKALIALSKAYHATLAYEESSNGSKTRKQQMTIASKWFKVGILLQGKAPDLSNRFDLKSRYWREGATWDSKAISDAKIGLQDVWRETNVRLRKA